jgi:RNA polymerase sigma factor (sigma-70 family)
VHSAVHDTIAAVWRAESAHIVAVVMRRVRDLGVAEELAQDALLAALEHWPLEGLPQNPAAWLMTTAKHRALDHLRHRQMAAQREGELALDMQAWATDHTPDFVDALGEAMQDGIGDDLLRLIFAACHPRLSADARVALTLKLLGGLSTHDIARAFLVSETTVAQRIVRAKRVISEAGLAFEVPSGLALGERLASVLEVVYLIFNAGHAATRGEDGVRPDLCGEAQRLGQLLARIAPNEAEVHGLVALMALQASRLPARTDAQGRPVLLADQDRRLWDAGLVQQGLAALVLAERLGPEPGAYQLQAALAACHARAARVEDTDWARVVALYEQLERLSPSPVVALNRAVAVSMHQGPAAALPVVVALAADPALRAYPWLWAVMGDLLARLGRRSEACAAVEQAAALTDNTAEKTMLLERVETWRAARP